MRRLRSFRAEAASRQGRHVLLVALLLLLAAGSALASGAHSGIAGRVLEGPTCPVERVPPQPGCAPRPLEATLRIRRAGSSSRGQLVRSGADGRFRIALRPGVYVVQGLSRNGSPFPRPPGPRRVSVSPGRYTHMTVNYDTGIR